MLLFWTPDDETPRGGIKQIYRHVEILHSAGFDARVLHTNPNFSISWFDHDAPIAYLGQSPYRRIRAYVSKRVSKLRLPKDTNLHLGRRIILDFKTEDEHFLTTDDLLVVPEFLGEALIHANIDIPFVVFNQNTHGTFRGYGYTSNSINTIYNSPHILGAIVVSDHNLRYLQHAFPKLKVYRVINGVDELHFNPTESTKKRQIAFMPRKLPQHLEQIISILNIRNALNGWELAPISNLSEINVAHILRNSLIFLSTCKEEGFGLPPVEAGMSGCYVIGYTGSAADEYFCEGLCERIAQDDVLTFAQSVEKTLQWAETNQNEVIARGQAFAQYLSNYYSLTCERESVLSVWHSILRGN